MSTRWEYYKKPPRRIAFEAYHGEMNEELEYVYTRDEHQWERAVRAVLGAAADTPQDLTDPKKPTKPGES